MFESIDFSLRTSVTSIEHSNTADGPAGNQSRNSQSVSSRSEKIEAGGARKRRRNHVSNDAPDSSMFDDDDDDVEQSPRLVIDTKPSARRTTRVRKQTKRN